MANIDDLINQLGEEGADKPMLHPLKQSLGWIIGMLVLFAFLLSLDGLRYDIDNKLSSPYFILELASLFLISATATILSFYGQRPDGVSNKSYQYMPFVLILLWLGLSVFTPTTTHGSDSFSNALNAMAIMCTCHLFIVVALPIFAIFYFMRRGASVQHCWTGGMAILGVSSAGYLFMRLSEGSDDLVHLMVWHALPVALMCFIAMGVSKFFLRW